MASKCKKWLPPRIRSVHEGPGDDRWDVKQHSLPLLPELSLRSVRATAKQQFDTEDRDYMPHHAACCWEYQVLPSAACYCNSCSSMGSPPPQLDCQDELSGSTLTAGRTCHIVAHPHTKE
jgi:hypothetical protein